MNIEKINNKINKLLEVGTDTEVLEAFLPFLSRVDISSQFIEEDGLIMGSLLFIQAGDKVITSDPEKFEWPLQALPIPDAFKGKLN